MEATQEQSIAAEDEEVAAALLDGLNELKETQVWSKELINAIKPYCKNFDKIIANASAYQPEIQAKLNSACEERDQLRAQVHQLQQ